MTGIPSRKQGNWGGETENRSYAHLTYKSYKDVEWFRNGLVDKFCSLKASSIGKALTTNYDAVMIASEESWWTEFQWWGNNAKIHETQQRNLDKVNIKALLLDEKSRFFSVADVGGGGGLPPSLILGKKRRNDRREKRQQRK